MTTRICPRCGGHFDVANWICPHCGAEFARARPARPGWVERLAPAHGILTKGVIGVTAIAFVIQLVLESRYPGAGTIGTSPSVRMGAGVPALVQHGQLWRLVTPMFLHAGLLHVGVNMFVLFQLGPLVEQAFGRSRFLVLYLLAGVAGSVASTVYQPAYQPSVGASGAICGLLGIMAVWGFRRGGLLGEMVKRQMIQWAAVILVFGLLVPHVDNAAHVGGFAGGAALAFLISPTGFRPETALRRRLWNVAAALAVLAAAACVGMAVLNFIRTMPA